MKMCPVKVYLDFTELVYKEPKEIDISRSRYIPKYTMESDSVD